MSVPRGVPLVNLSRKSAEAHTQRLIRLNATTPAHAHPYNPDDERAPKSVRSKLPIVQRVRHPDEAMPPPAIPVRLRAPYVPGEGDPFVQSVRPGADDNKKFKSKGF